MRFAALACGAVCILLVGGAQPQARGQAGPAPKNLALIELIEQPGQLPVREPMVVEHPSGVLFVSGFAAAKATLWRSADRGKSWSLVDAEKTGAGLLGNSDVDLAVAPDGTLYWATMTFIAEAREGVQISVAISRDVGTSWSWTLISRRRFDDRPWVKVARDGTAHIVWNDGSGVWHVTSADRGTTWAEPQRVHPAGGSSHLAVGPGGEVAVRVTPRSASGMKLDPGVDLIAVSSDRGRTWAKHVAPGTREWHLESAVPLRRWVEPIAWDAAGRLYSAWSTPDAIWLAHSDDRGASWRESRIEEGGPIRYYPYLTARAAGEVALTWFSGQGDALMAHLAALRIADGSARTESVAMFQFRPDSWRRVAPDATQFVRAAAGEYFPVSFLRDGSVVVVSTIQHDIERRFGFAWRRFEWR